MNIGPKEQKKRLLMGLVMSFLVALSFFLLMPYTEVSKVSRLTLFFPIYMAFLCFFQVKAKTCVIFALKGLMNVDDELRVIQNEEAKQQAMKQAYAVFVQSFIASFILTFVLCLL